MGKTIAATNALEQNASSGVIKEERLLGKGMGTPEQKTNDVVPPDGESASEYADQQRTTYTALQPHLFGERGSDPHGKET